MSRDDGFEVADTDTGMLADPKILALARRLHDSIRTGAAIALYDAVRLASWKAGQRLTLDETAPGWWLEPFDDLAAELVAVRLLDDERRVPEHAFEGWFGPARDRRERYRELGSKGGQARVANSRKTARSLSDTDYDAGMIGADPTARSTVRSTARSTVRSSPSVPTVPTVPTEPPVTLAPARERGHGMTMTTTTKKAICFFCKRPVEGRNFHVTGTGRIAHNGACPEVPA
jgi:hypothetical protein